MGIKDVSRAVASIALELHPERIEAICAALDTCESGNFIAAIKSSLGESFYPRLIHDLASALEASPNLTGAELSTIFRASSATAALAAGQSSVELVWTGPHTGMVPVRHTAQVVTGLIEQAHERLFLVSFVAYHVGGVISALQSASARGVLIRVLLERSQEHGGNVTVDSLKILKESVPSIKLYEWDKASCGAPTHASVHAKCAVADGSSAFITSANLSEAAMEHNMEAGILIRGGRIPKQLEGHLQALVTTRQIVAV